MSTYLHYQIWVGRAVYAPAHCAGDFALEKQLASGTIAVNGSMSAPVAIPDLINQTSDAERRITGIFKVIGNDRVFVDARQYGSPASTSAVAGSDPSPLHLFSGEDGYILVPLPPGGQFGAVQAAAIP